MKAINRVKKYIESKGLSNSSFEKKSGLSNGYIATQLKRNADLGEGVLNKILDNCLDMNPDWLLTGSGEMLRIKNTVVKENYEGLPLIPIDAMAGFGTGSQQIMDYDTKKYNVPEFTELNAEFMIRVKGSSMYPKYNSGDLLACKKINMTFFQWNKVYVLDTEQGALIKRIKPSEKEDHIQCVSDNKSYDPFDLHINEVNAIAIVLGVIRLE